MYERANVIGLNLRITQMIIGIIHKGSGLGDQLFSYIATRVRAADLGVDFGFFGSEYFKGKDFMELDWGNRDFEHAHQLEPNGKLIPFMDRPIFELNKPYYDPEFNFIPERSIIDGYGAQDIRYFEHRLDEVREWLKVEPLDMSDDLCVINFRGGEYASIPDLFLPQEYWGKALLRFLDFRPGSTQFQVHTDDIKTATEFLPTPEKISDIALNWRSLRYAKNAIISNSAFAIIPRLLKHLEDPEAVTIAPFGWNARNASLTEWKGRPQNYYRQFTYI